MIPFDRSRLLDEGLPPEVRARRAMALDLAEAAVDAIESGRATVSALERLSPPSGMTGFAFGKASVAMARAAAPWVSRGILISLTEAEVAPFEHYVGAHPDPAPDAEAAGRAVAALARSLGPHDAALCLVSGGASSMLELARPSMSLDVTRRLIRRLREDGADISEQNAVRAACSELKGGGLARLIAPAPIYNVVISDVPGHPIEIVGSGPTFPPRPSPVATEVLARHGIDAILPEPRPGGLPVIRTEVAADHRVARKAVVEAAARRGLGVEDREGTFSGDASTFGRALARERFGGAWVWGGETTVIVRGAGVGGRNQEVVLGALAEGWGDGLLLSLGTDGIDGASDAAGALVDAHVVDEVARRGLDPAVALARNDATPLLDAVGATLRCGPTGTNVADLCLFLP